MAEKLMQLSIAFVTQYFPLGDDLHRPLYIWPGYGCAGEGRGVERSEERMGERGGATCAWPGGTEIGLDQSGNLEQEGPCDRGRLWTRRANHRI